MFSLYKQGQTENENEKMKLAFLFVVVIGKIYNESMYVQEVFFFFFYIASR